MWSQKPSFRLEIDNFSEKDAAVKSQTFVSGGCEWFLQVHPKGDHRCDDHMSLYLNASNPKSSQTGWKRRARFYFSVLNQSDKELYRSPITWYTGIVQGWGFRKTLPLSKFEKDGFLENDVLIIEVYINVLEANDGEGEEDVSKKKENMDLNGFQAFASQVNSVTKTFTERVSKKEYMNVLSNACSKVSEFAEEGLKMDWLKSKFDEVSLKMKKADDADGSLSQIQQHEERIKNLELMGSELKMENIILKSKLEDFSLERKKENDAAESSHIQQLEERIKNLELMREKDADGSQVRQLEERMKNLELMELETRLESLESKLEDVSSNLEEGLEKIEELESELGDKIDELESELEDVSSKLEEGLEKIEELDEEFKSSQN